MQSWQPGRLINTRAGCALPPKVHGPHMSSEVCSCACTVLLALASKLASLDRPPHASLGTLTPAAGTYTKSFGSCGGYIASSHAVIDHLRRHSPAHLYATAMSPAAVQQVSGSARGSVAAGTGSRLCVCVMQCCKPCGGVPTDP